MPLGFWTPPPVGRKNLLQKGGEPPSGHGRFDGSASIPLLLIPDGSTLLSVAPQPYPSYVYIFLAPISGETKRGRGDAVEGSASLRAGVG